MRAPISGLSAGVALVVLLSATMPAFAFPQLVVNKMEPPPLDPVANLSSWSAAPLAALTWDVQGGHPSHERAVARIATDGTSLYLRFDVEQHEPIVATQRTNDVGQGTDDEVWVDLWPTGPTGFEYQFFSTPNGTHYETSTENTTYAPRWVSYGAVGTGSYTVTMKIPLAVMRGAQTSHEWKLQFGRYVRSTGEQAVWSYDYAQTVADDPARAGSVRLAAPTVQRRQARLSTYVLGEAASSSVGGSTSRAGADVSIPITASSSLYATFHPDFSNVELDQQTISPTVFPRAYSEVRPFFTQGANNFNDFYCNFCNALLISYSPAIPTPSNGYALEGKQGDFSFTSFDSLSSQRVDRATALDYASNDLRWNATVEQSGVNTIGLHDDATLTGITYSDLKYLTLYANYGNDAGTDSLVGDRSQYEDAGATWTTQTFSAWGGLHRIGQYFNPVDGFILYPDVAGWGLFTNKIWTMQPSDVLAAVSLGGTLTRNHSFDGPLDQTSNRLDFDALTRGAVDVNVTSGSSYLLLGDGVLTPISQAGAAVTFHSGSQTNNPITFDAHGPSATPTTFSYSTGRFGLGRLDTWVRTSTIRAGQRGTLTFAVDDTDQRFADAASNVQWFDRIGYTYQSSSESSFGVGLRKVVGMPPVPNGGGGCVGTCTNVSVAYHARMTHSEVYFAYGDPNALITAPQLVLKLILYTGADKGT